MSWIKNLVLLTFATLLAVKVTDLAIGVIYPENRTGLVNRGENRSIILKEINPSYVANLTPTKEYLRNTDSLEVRSYSVRTDEHGFIINGNPPVKANVEIGRIVFLGGSTTESLLVEERQRWSSILERRLNEAALPKDYEVLNGGVSGNNILHSTLNMVAKVIPQRPDYVVLMHNINDLAMLRQSGNYWNAPQSRAIVQVDKNENFRILLREIKDWFVPNAYKLIKGLLARADDFAVYREQPTFGIELTGGEFRRALETFIHVSRAWNIEPILMTQFNRINLNDELFVQVFRRPDIEEYVSNYHTFNEIVREVGSNEGVDVIDLASEVPSRSEYIYDIVHLNGAGSRFVADILEKYFVAKLAQ
jgi:lysophospholipase L1-like esterase